MVQLPPQTFANNTDTKAMLMTSGTPATTNYCKNAQWRIGGRYYPSQQITGDTFNTTWNGGCEYYVELQKALNQVGDYNISSSANAVRWSQQTTAGSLAFPASTTTLVSSTNVGFGPQNFVIATDFETSDGSEISGLNAGKK